MILNRSFIFFVFSTLSGISGLNCSSGEKERITASEPIDVGSRKQLFIDDALIASSQQIDLHMNPPVKTGEMTIQRDRPWENLGVGIGSVVETGDGYRMYYTARYQYFDENEPSRRLCLALSEDGIHWQKPSLGLVRFNGSADNNIIFPTDDSWFGGGSVFVDTRPNVQEDERYKMICRWVYPGHPLEDVSEWVLSSPDGLKWSQMSKEPSYQYSDTHLSGFWDDRIGRYVIFMRINSAPYYNREIFEREGVQDGKPVVFANNVGLMQGSEDGRTYIAPDDNRPWIPIEYRKVGRCESDDLVKWSKPEVAFSFDEQDPPGMDVDNTGTIKYPWADNVYLMFPAMYYHYPIPPVGEFHNDGVFEVRLATSRNGVNFRYPSRSPFVPLGVTGEFDSGLTSMKIGIIRRGSQLYLYYGARNDKLRHGAGGPEVYRKNPPVISRLTLRVDGFVSADAPYEGGELTTVPVTFQGNALHLNVQTSLAGSVRVELIQDGKPITGYTALDSDVIRGNFIDHNVTWNGESDLSALSGKPLQMRFVMKDSKLYAFQFTGRQ